MLMRSFSLYPPQFECCGMHPHHIKATTHSLLTGYQNTTSAGLFSQDAKQDFCTDLDNKSGCERKIVKFANDYINSVFSWVA